MFLLPVLNKYIIQASENRSEQVKLLLPLARMATKKQTLHNTDVVTPALAGTED